MSILTVTLASLRQELLMTLIDGLMRPFEAAFHILGELSTLVYHLLSFKNGHNIAKIIHS